MCKNLWPDELKILVVDDDREALNLIRISLEMAGFRVIRANRPEEGLNLAVRECPDLLLLDWVMPNIDGFEMLRRLRNNPRLCRVPAIIISAQSLDDNRRKMIHVAEPHLCTVDAYIDKPFSPIFLLQTIKSVMIKHKDYLLTKNM